MDDGQNYDSTTCPTGDGGGAGDSEKVYSLEEIEALEPYPLFIRGDVDWDEVLSINDAVRTLNSIFSTGGSIDCPEAADMNADGQVDLSDAIKTLIVLFISDADLPPLALEADANRSGDGLGCE